MTDLEQIKDRVDIVDLIQGYIRLQKAGMNFRANCPFHNEKTPSFMVSPDRQIWHCFGCSLGGDHFKFVMQIEGVEFPEALQILAKKAGVELKNFSKEKTGEKNELYEISELTAKFFTKQLWESDNGKKVLRYLKERGLEEETMKEWRFGYAPNTWASLKTFLKNAGFNDQEIFKTGLTVRNEKENSFYDRFRGRIMFPICDLNSQVVGFTGRIFEEITGEIDAGKYVNTPQTLIYDKSRVLYGLDKAKLETRKKDKVIVVEGNMDVIMSHQAGVKNAVASSGTALTNQHLKILRRYTQNIDLCFDEDMAGEIAAKRGIDLAVTLGFNVGVLNLSAKDPADLVKEDSARWVQASQKSEPIVKFYIEKAFQKYDKTTALGKKNIAYEVLPVIKLIDNKVEQAHWLDELSNKLRVDQKVIIQVMAGIKTQNNGQPVSQKDDSAKFEMPSRLVLEETLLALLFRMPQKANELILSPDEEKLEIFSDKFYNNLFERLKSGDTFKGPFPYEDNLRIELIKFKSEQFFGDIEEKDLESEISRLVKSLKKELILEKIKELELKIKEAKNQEEIPLLLQRVRNFSNKLSLL
ncbi:MAG: DNA primase [Parcubacteria group bacterium RIFCSPHIGHO2_01_FULL_40_30]|nr:MAG: DNA primase [Parcubacteria group bacterium RIFCSPHIGHO2_01_FULL_40_30]OHB22500.1 MAG: DNA primase [Parcubacteria group bacterium RIFCSPLOWO2_02_FULL_40_12]